MHLNLNPSDVGIPIPSEFKDITNKRTPSRSMVYLDPLVPRSQSHRVSEHEQIWIWLPDPELLGDPGGPKTP